MSVVSALAKAVVWESLCLSEAKFATLDALAFNS